MVLTGISAVIQTVWFCFVLSGNPLASLEELAGGGALAVPFLVCFLLASALLSITGCEMGARCGYTLRRLSVSERTIFAWQWGYNSACFLLLWLVELLTAFGLCTLYTMKAGPFFGERTNDFSCLLQKFSSACASPAGGCVSLDPKSAVCSCVRSGLCRPLLPPAPGKAGMGDSGSLHNDTVCLSQCAWPMGVE